MNLKQQLYSERKAFSYIQKKYKAMFLILSAMFFVVTAIMMIAGDISLSSFFHFGTVNIAIGAMVSIAEVDPTFARPAIKNRLYLLRSSDEVDWDTMPTPDSSTMTIGAISRKNGKTWHYIDCIESTVKPNAKSAGDISPQLALEIPADGRGITPAILKFLYENNGGRFVVGWENCSTGSKYVSISPCERGMKMTVERLGNDDSYNGFQLKFTSTCPEPYYVYDGAFDQSTPSTVAANATAIPIDSVKSTYQLTSGTASAVNITGFSGVVAGDTGRVLEILGSGGTYPSTIDSDDNFTLENGATWTAISGAKLTVKVYKDGASTYKFIEVPGTRV